MRLAVAGDNSTYAETDYANPHAPTSFFGGVATTTYAYDANGNLTGTTGAATSSFTWDYRNRMITIRTVRSASTPGVPMLIAPSLDSSGTIQQL